MLCLQVYVMDRRIHYIQSLKGRLNVYNRINWKTTDIRVNVYSIQHKQII